MKYLATALFAGAILHTFCVKFFLRRAHRYPAGSMGEKLFHFLGEVEVVFGLWAGVLIAVWSATYGPTEAAQYLSSVNYTEAVFVFVVMCMAATRPILVAADYAIGAVAKLLPMSHRRSLYFTSLTIGPLLGSLITEPAAMTVVAILLRDKFFNGATTRNFRYATLGLLFVNVSIGGTLTNFAAPPILMVANPWNWTTPFMASTFGWKAAVAILLGTLATVFIFRRELTEVRTAPPPLDATSRIPLWIVVVNLGFLVLTIVTVHYMSFFVPLFLLFLGWCSVSAEFQDRLRVKESLLVGFFLGGLVTLGKLQDWWIQPLLASTSDQPLFWGTLSLTAFTDNAALTYLGTLVPSLSDTAKYALVGGAVAGGGLTVIANAPNPIGYGLLRGSFGEDGISAIGLLLGALPYTLLAAAAFLLL